MSEQKHTAWELKISDNEVWAEIYDSNGLSIVGMEVDGDPELIANAHLIAAAPAMYEALKSIANGEGVYGPQAHEYKQIARAAVASAEHQEKER